VESRVVAQDGDQRLIRVRVRPAHPAVEAGEQPIAERRRRRGPDPFDRLECEKLLPARFEEHPDRFRRFQQRRAGAFDHPGQCHIAH
jgi:hypothetical protein